MSIRLLSVLVAIVLIQESLSLAPPSDLPPPSVAVATGKIGWVGLGAMGTHMAMHIHQSNDKQDLLVWNRTPERAREHAATHGTRTADSLAKLSKESSVVFLSLPTTSEVEQVINSLTDLEPGSIIVDTTSGEPKRTKELADACLHERGIYLVDCPVSGGPAGARAGTLTCMLGGDESVVQAVQPILSFGKSIFNCGPVGSGMACKSINNILNTAHLLIGAEGLLMLKKFGVEPDVALSVINASSGRSLQTEARLPEDVLTGKFGYGFKLSLMAKDCRIAASIAETEFPKATILPEISRLMNKAEKRFPEGDYTESVRLLEEEAGTDLRVD